jgi:hypothetical protein
MTKNIKEKLAFSWGILGACAIALSSCATNANEQVIPITVLSDPPGARIESNGQFIGTTPLKTEIHRYKDLRTGEWSGLAINAFPTKPGQCTQHKYFPEDVPMATQMFFDMGLCPVAPMKHRSSG